MAIDLDVSRIVHQPIRELHDDFGNKSLIAGLYAGGLILLVGGNIFIPWNAAKPARVLTTIMSNVAIAAGIWQNRKLEKLQPLLANREKSWLSANSAILAHQVAPYLDGEVVETQALPPAQSKPTLQLFDWKRFKTEHNVFPHIRVIGKTGQGKTLLTQWLMSLLGGEKSAISPKPRSKNMGWHQQGIKVYGEGSNFDECCEYLNSLLEEMQSRYSDDKYPSFINCCIDEWLAIAQFNSSAVEIVKQLLVLARDSQIRLLALAQSENVKPWGLDGAGDLRECFTDIRLGNFAIKHASSYRAKCRKDSDEYQYWSHVLAFLQSQERPCMVDDVPARVPDLSNWKPESELLPVEREEREGTSAAAEIEKGEISTIETPKPLVDKDSSTNSSKKEIALKIQYLAEICDVAESKIFEAVEFLITSAKSNPELKGIKTLVLGEMLGLKSERYTKHKDEVWEILVEIAT